MAHHMDRYNLPLKAASAINQNVPVTFNAAASALSETVIRAGSVNDDVLGMSIASAAAGAEVAVSFYGVTKGVAGASLGAGARLGVGSTNGILIPLTASNIASAANGTGLRYTVGRALKNAAAGDVIPIVLDPTQII